MSKRLKDPANNLDVWLRWQLRRASYKWPARSEALRQARAERGLYKCAKCGRLIKNKELAVDHVDPIIDPREGFVNWETYINRMFCEASGFQILCRKPCHQEKTNAENAIRHKHRTGTYSVETAAKIAEAQKGHIYLRGIPKTLAHRLAMSQERKGKPQTSARKAVLDKVHELACKPVIGLNLRTGKTREFKSIGQAALLLGIVASNISKVCNQKEGREQTGGWKFKYKEAA